MRRSCPMHPRRGGSGQVGSAVDGSCSDAGSWHACSSILDVVSGSLPVPGPHARGSPGGVSMTRTALIAIGGNALVLDGEPGSIPRQQERAAQFAEQVADLVVDGWTVVVTHGNGPQVGFILRRGELVAAEAEIEGLPELPLWLAVADSQGGIGHILAVALDNALARRGMSTRAVAVLTHAEVARDDPAFAVPTKPIGSQMSAAVAQVAVAQGWTVAETSAGVFRRV